MRGAYNFRAVQVRSSTAPARVFRSGQLLLSTRAARRRMAGLGITLVIDLRSPATAKAFPDPPIPGAERLAIDLIGPDDVDNPAGLSGADLMNARYRQFVVNPGQRSRIARVLRAIAEHGTHGDRSAAVLVHCTDGKDRTGWIAFLLQHIGGDDEAALHEAYLASLPRVRWLGALRFLATMARRGPRFARSQHPINTVHRDFLESAVTAALTTYGSLDAYLVDGLGLDESTLRSLRAMVA